jgi:hypothetical protein
MVSDPVWSRLQNDFVLVSQYTDDQDNPVPRENLDKYAPDVITVPLYLVVDSDGKELARLMPPTNIANLTAEEFAAFLDKGKAAFRK